MSVERIAAPAPQASLAPPSRRRDWPPVVPLVVVGVFALCALVAPIAAPHSAVDGSLVARLKPPLGLPGSDPEYVLGTDRLGRDILSRLMVGAQISLSVSLLAIGLTGALGAAGGMLAGMAGGWVEVLLMRLVDVSLSLPGILIAILMAVVFKPSFTNVVVVVGFVLWPSYARLVRGEVLALKHQDYIALARVAGCSNLTIMLRHMLPNVLPSVLVLATLHVGFVIILEAVLSFLGVGVPPPTPSWGAMVADGRSVLETAWWVSIIPGLTIFAIVLSCNVLGEWVRDRLDPRSRQV
jgi:peptide/nickel transport system permease protein